MVGRLHPYGYETNPQASVNHYKFTGLEHDDETGQDHAVFRQHVSAWGRWLTPDPAGMAAADLSNPQSLNRYAYVMNNPLNAVDPTGLDGTCDEHGNCTVTGSAPMPNDDLLDLILHPCRGGETDICYSSSGVIGSLITTLFKSFGSGKLYLGQSNGTQVCTANAHGVYNDLPTRKPNQKGAYGVPETPGTAAIDRSQWLPPGSAKWTGTQANAYINKYRNQISGSIPDDHGGYKLVFNAVSGAPLV